MGMASLKKKDHKEQLSSLIAFSIPTSGTRSSEDAHALSASGGVFAVLCRDGKLLGASLYASNIAKWSVFRRRMNLLCLRRLLDLLESYLRGGEAGPLRGYQIKEVVE